MHRFKMWAPRMCGAIAAPAHAGATNKQDFPMNKAELIEHLAAKQSLPKAASGSIVETLLDAIVSTVKKGGSVVIPGFGSFQQQRVPHATA
jgi:DNA-binding protein HU-beta